MQRQVVGRWAIEREIATGGFGNVYEARHLDHRGLAALKLLHPRFAASPEMRTRFEREVDALRQLEHPNIVRLLDAGISPEGAPFLCMERLVGETLAARIERGGPLPFEDVLDICRVVCDALAFTHARGMIHRDINASNVFLCGDLERVVLLDFGIAKHLDSGETELTASHETVGTPSWMAPEQIRGQPVDVRSDVYAVGALLFFLLTGKPPFHDPSPATVQYLHLHARRPFASELVAVSGRVDDVLRRAMAIEPRARFASVSALRDAFFAAMRALGQTTAPRARDCAWLLLTVSRPAASPLRIPVIADIESVLPEAERWLAQRSFRVALELGSTVVYVSTPSDGATVEAPAIAHALRAHLDDRPTRHEEVSIGIAIQRGVGMFVADELHASPLISIDAWPVTAAFDGVVVI
ncbi:MAG: serine/threonine-protein kinase [Deltaproteobacteria bacterium]